MDMNELRRFVGLCDDGQDALLSMCLDAAKDWYMGAGVPDLGDDKLYTFWVYNLTAWFFDNRGATGDDAHIPPGIVTSVHQLRARGGGTP